MRKGGITMENVKNIEIINTSLMAEEVGPGGADMCINVCLSGCASTAGFGTLGAITVGMVVGAV